MPSITRAAVDAALVGRARTLLSLIGMSIVTDGTNPDTVDPLSVGLASLGVYPATYGAVTNTDLVTVQPADVPQLIDVAELRMLLTARNRFTDVRTRVGIQSEVYWSDLLASLDARVKELRTDLRRNYGLGLQPLVPGTIRIPSVTTDPTLTNLLYPPGG